jgi:hypothetical protein
LSLVEVVD